MVKHGKAKSGSLSRTGTSLVSRNLVICGRRTTVRLEDEMWESLKNVAEREECSVNALGSRIYRQKKSDESFTSAIRIFLMLYYRDAAREAGHAEAMQRPGTPESCRASVEEGEGRVAGVLPALRLCNLRRKSTARGAALKPTTRMNGPEVVNREGST